MILSHSYDLLNVIIVLPKDTEEMALTLSGRKNKIYFDNIDVGTRRADFVVVEQAIVEKKALRRLEDVQLAQAKNYVVAYDREIGLLINFGGKSLEFNKVNNP